MTRASPPPPIGFSPGSWADYTLIHRLPKIVDDIRALPSWDAEAQRRLASLRDTLPDGLFPSSPLRDAVDGDFWNRWLGEHAGARWPSLSYFDAETVFYQLILAAVGYVDERSRDPFAEKKRASLLGGAEDAIGLADWLESSRTVAAEAIGDALAFALRANRADLSLLSIASTDAELIVDDRARAAEILSSSPATFAIDYALDNAGVELFGDLALMDQILRSFAGASLRVHVKPYPFFVSDATMQDFRDALAFLEGHSHAAARDWGMRISRAMADGRLELATHPFWCRPLHFTEMPVELRARIQSSRLFLLKGDLNFRRYLEDRSWPHDEPASALRIAELPPTLALRVLKSEIMVGLPPGRAEALFSRAPDWLHSGAFAAIQLFQ